MRFCEQVLEAEPWHAGAMCNTGLCIEAVHGDTSTAVIFWGAALKADSRCGAALSNLARIAHLKGNVYESARLYERALQLPRVSEPTYFNYGVLLHTELGRFSDAEAMYRNALQVTHLPNAFFFKPYFIFRADRPNECKDCIEPCSHAAREPRRPAQRRALVPRCMRASPTRLRICREPAQLCS